jgi:alkylresorcinol/alkylpyrone synthase
MTLFTGITHSTNREVNGATPLNELSRMRIAGVCSALPEHRYSQATITAALKHHWNGTLQRPELLDRLHARAGVEHRHLAFPIDRYARFGNWGESNAAWLEVAQDLGVRAIDGALGRAGLERRDLDALFVVSITGVASPSLDARLINAMRLRSDIKRTPIFGVGCVGGALGLTRAADYVLAYPRHTAALLSVEVCSLTIQRDDLSTANLISTGLFGDGAAAVIVTGAERSGNEPAAAAPAGVFAGPRILGCRSVFYPDSEDVMGWDISHDGFRIVLSPRLPDLIRRHLAGDLDAFLRSFGLAQADIGNWLIHTGGPKVLEAIQDSLGLAERELDRSWECLRRCGNLSSASVLLVLEDTMMRDRPAPGTLGVLLAMGPGFCAEMILVRW